MAGFHNFNFNTIKIALWPFFQGQELWQKLYTVEAAVNPDRVFQ